MTKCLSAERGALAVAFVSGYFEGQFGFDSLGLTDYALVLQF